MNLRRADVVPEGLLEVNAPLTQEEKREQAKGKDKGF